MISVLKLQSQEPEGSIDLELKMYIGTKNLNDKHK
jgi:hypothetical protein